MTTLNIKLDKKVILYIKILLAKKMNARINFATAPSKPETFISVLENFFTDNSDYIQL
jgi:hypothetical protein